MPAIVMFYKKAKAFEQLALFYENQAQNEINEYRNYEKALNAMIETIKAMKNTSNLTELKKLESKTQFISEFVKVTKEGININNCKRALTKYNELINNPKAESAIRIGDVITQVIEYYCNIGKFKNASKYLKIMESKGIEIRSYIDQSVIEAIKTLVKDNSVEDEDAILVND